jgi:hypothetical protein
MWPRKSTDALASLLLLVAAMAGGAQTGQEQSYAGFDRNDYPGDAALPALGKSFRYTSYWLNAPPGEVGNSWEGKRAILRRFGFGFLVLFNGHTDAELKKAASRGEDAAALGAADGKAAAAAAAREGFPARVLIFLDQEEGGRLLPEQAAYVFAWIDAVRAAGERAGVYCSGIPVQEDGGSITTAEDIAEREAARARLSSKGGGAERLAIWVADDACPPAPGCTPAQPPLRAAFSAPEPAYTAVWQYAQSPRRIEFSAKCPKNDAPDGNCYAPGLAPSANSFIDLDTADSADPSEGR